MTAANREYAEMERRLEQELNDYIADGTTTASDPFGFGMVGSLSDSIMSMLDHLDAATFDDSCIIGVNESRDHDPRKDLLTAIRSKHTVLEETDLGAGMLEIVYIAGDETRYAYQTVRPTSDSAGEHSVISTKRLTAAQADRAYDRAVRG